MSEATASTSSSLQFVHVYRCVRYPLKFPSALDRLSGSVPRGSYKSDKFTYR